MDHNDDDVNDVDNVVVDDDDERLDCGGKIGILLVYQTLYCLAGFPSQTSVD